MGMAATTTPWWTWTWPLLAWAILLASPFVGESGLVDAAAGIALVATVFAAVHHAEVVAHRTGEPFGTLILAVAVTVIEVALIVSVMVAAPAKSGARPRYGFRGGDDRVQRHRRAVPATAVPATTSRDFKSMEPVPLWRCWPR